MSSNKKDKKAVNLNDMFGAFENFSDNNDQSEEED
jgi:hypothetical protein